MVKYIAIVYECYGQLSAFLVFELDLVLRTRALSTTMYNYNLQIFAIYKYLYRIKISATLVFHKLSSSNNNPKNF